MQKQKLVKSVVTFLVVGLFTIPVFSSEDPAPTTSKTGELAPVSADEPVSAVKEGALRQPQMLSFYGEIQSADVSLSSLTFQYYDYENDEDKIVELTVNSDTNFENATSLDDIKKGDWAEIDYTVRDGKNIATLIVVDRDEELDVVAPNSIE
ncbi:MAG: hypothetical protein PHW46_00520 [Candidatus Omnitrophica bacterium]|nr:hypothetical protein [Candidatus Omnitrophota bacterium]